MVCITLFVLGGIHSNYNKARLRDPASAVIYFSDSNTLLDHSTYGFVFGCVIKARWHAAKERVAPNTSKAVLLVEGLLLVEHRLLLIHQLLGHESLLQTLILDELHLIAWLDLCLQISIIGRLGRVVDHVLSIEMVLVGTSNAGVKGLGQALLHGSLLDLAQLLLVTDSPPDIKAAPVAPIANITEAVVQVAALKADPVSDPLGKRPLGIVVVVFFVVSVLVFKLIKARLNAIRARL